MQCSHCHFENMPGIDVCGRCGTSLRLSSAAIDIHPPRASRWAKWRRKCFVSATQARSLPELLRRFSANQFGPMTIDCPASSLAWRMVVPGWPQIHAGWVSRGRVLLGTYLASLAAGLLLLGTPAGGIFLGIALAVHASSIFDIVRSSAQSLGECLGQYARFVLLVAVIVYVPAGWLLTRFASPRQIAQDTPPLLAGDVYLVSRASYYLSAPQPGDVVCYRIPRANVRVVTRGGDAAAVFAGGEAIDRILAGPGQRVVWEEMRLSVDGQASPWQPLNPAAFPDRLALTVPDDAYFILPSTNFQARRLTTASLQSDLATVGKNHFVGKVMVRSYPFSRFGLVR
ncbi:MAG: hypothetical protein GX621_10000 [Pirellulaceae bacterium]|nr:hypothetical protein [Pirellulaceae bacterium]